MVVLLRPGLLGDVWWVDAHRTWWTLGWLLWLAAFYAAVAVRFGERAPIRTRMALVVAAAGLAADVSAETILMVRPGSLQLVGPLTGYVGNGLYTVAGVLLLWSGARGLPRW